MVMWSGFTGLLSPWLLHYVPKNQADWISLFRQSGMSTFCKSITNRDDTIQSLVVSLAAVSFRAIPTPVDTEGCVETAQTLFPSCVLSARTCGASNMYPPNIEKCSGRVQALLSQFNWPHQNVATGPIRTFWLPAWTAHFSWWPSARVPLKAYVEDRRTVPNNLDYIRYRPHRRW